MQFYLIIGLAAALAIASPMDKNSNSDSRLPLSRSESLADVPARQVPANGSPDEPIENPTDPVVNMPSGDIITGTAVERIKPDGDFIEIIPYFEYDDKWYNISGVNFRNGLDGQLLKPCGVHALENGTLAPPAVGKPLNSWLLFDRGDKVAMYLTQQHPDPVYPNDESKLITTYHALAQRNNELVFDASLNPLEFPKPSAKVDFYFTLRDIQILPVNLRLGWTLLQVAADSSKGANIHYIKGAVRNPSDATAVNMDKNLEHYEELTNKLEDFAIRNGRFIPANDSQLSRSTAVQILKDE